MPLGKWRCGWKDSLKMHRKEVGYDAVDKSQVIQIRGQLLQTIHGSVGRESSVGIATRYGLDGPGLESRWGRDFSHTVQTGSGAHTLS